MTRRRGQQPIPFMYGTRQTTSPVQSLFCCAWLLALSMLVASCASTQASGADTSAPIQQSEYLAVDGAKLFLMTRGKDRRAPILLWLHGGPGLFGQNGAHAQHEQEALQTELFEQIGRLKMELEWVKKKAARHS